MEKRDRLQYLLERFNNNTADAAELTELQQLLNDPNAIALLDDLWDKSPNNALFFDEGNSENMLAAIRARNAELPQRPVLRMSRTVLALAASIIILITITAIYLSQPTTKPSTTTVATTNSSTVLPGSDKAVLVLADGSTILLDSTGNAVIPVQGNTRVLKVDGQLVYNSTDSATLLYNLLKTPRGGQYQLQLADGSKVWMNAGSSLRFPTSFPGKERVVELTGEAYFEIAKDAKRPFRVTINEVSVNVLGTHFNVMAYDNEAAAAITLLEGAVRVERKDEKLSMQPGQQVLAGNSTLQLLQHVDIEEAVAWKNGFFVSNNTPLPVLMRQIERWYNIEVAYEGKVPNRKFGGKIPRKADLNEVLKILQLSKVYTTAEAGKITVLDR